MYHGHVYKQKDRIECIISADHIGIKAEIVKHDTADVLCVNVTGGLPYSEAITPLHIMAYDTGLTIIKVCDKEVLRRII